MEPGRSPPSVQYGSPPKPARKKKKQPTMLERLNPAFATGQAMAGTSPPKRPRRRGGAKRDAVQLDLTQESPPKPPPFQLSQAPPVPPKRQKKKKPIPQLGPGLLAHFPKIGAVQRRLRSAYQRGQLQRQNPAIGGISLFAGSLPLRVSPDALEPEPMDVEGDEKAHEASVTLGLSADPVAMVPWETRKQEAISRLGPRIQSLIQQHAGWGEDLLRNIDLFALQRNKHRQAMGKGVSKKGFEQLSLKEVVIKFPAEVKQIVDKHLKLWNVRNREPSPPPAAVPLPKTPPRRPSPSAEEYIPRPIPATPREGSPASDTSVPGIRSPEPSPEPVRNPARDLLNAFDGLNVLPEIPDPRQSVLPQTATLRAEPEERLVPYSLSRETTPGGEPSLYQGDVKGERSSVNSAYRTGTRELMNRRAGAQQQLNILAGPARNPRSEYMRAFSPGYIPGRPELIQRSQRSVASSFQRARSKMLNVPRGLQKSGGYRGMQVLKKLNFHIEQLSPNELILHARIVNDGVVHQVRGLVAGISRPILVDGQKVSRKKIVNHILSILEEKNHVRISVDS